MVVSVDVETSELVQVDYMTTIVTAKTRERNIRVGEDNVARARSIHQTLETVIDEYGVKFFFSEIPTGGKSAKVATSFGIVQGILAGISVPLFPLTPTEVKQRSVGDKRATKTQIMTWAVQLPLAGDAKWPTRKKGDKDDIKVPSGGYLLKNAEHIADGCAAIVAGITGNEFRRSLAMIQGLI